VPELPINLRVLAESILLRRRSGKVKIAASMEKKFHHHQVAMRSTIIDYKFFFMLSF